jgi:hypothetical protein
MSAKGEICWNRRDENDERIQVYARHFGGHWKFFKRGKRYDVWQEIAEPMLEDWMELLDAVKRRVPRRLFQPKEVDKIRSTIRERFPEAEV